MNNYDTIWNGDSCFRVKIADKVKVIKLEFDDNKYIETDVEFEYDVENVYIGQSPKTKSTLYSKGYGIVGSSILLHIKDNKYIWVGNEVYSFTANAKINYFVSPVGNNYVPYPYAYDNDNNIYLFAEHIILVNSNSIKTLIECEILSREIYKDYNSHEEVKDSIVNEPYSYYYDNEDELNIDIGGHVICKYYD